MIRIRHDRTVKEFYFDISRQEEIDNNKDQLVRLIVARLSLLKIETLEYYDLITRHETKPHQGSS